MNPVPFLTEKEKLDHRSYVAIARKLHEFDGLGLSKNLKTREDLISELIKSKIYSQEEIDMMADANCQNTNLLFDDGIVFWRFREKSVSFVNRAWGAHLESKKSFDSRFKHDKNAR